MTKKRTNVLYTRLTKHNSNYLKKAAKKNHITQALLLNSHIAYLRKSFKAGNIPLTLAKTRNKIQKSVQKAT